MSGRENLILPDRQCGYVIRPMLCVMSRMRKVFGDSLGQLLKQVHHNSPNVFFFFGMLDCAE